MDVEHKRKANFFFRECTLHLSLMSFFDFDALLLQPSAASQPARIIAVL
jgi:hypothetical protein